MPPSVIEPSYCVGRMSRVTGRTHDARLIETCVCVSGCVHNTGRGGSAASVHIRSPVVVVVYSSPRARPRVAAVVRVDVEFVSHVHPRASRQQVVASQVELLPHALRGARRATVRGALVHAQRGETLGGGAQLALRFTAVSSRTHTHTRIGSTLGFNRGGKHVAHYWCGERVS